MDEQVAGPLRDVQRVIVSCVLPRCDDFNGEFRVDLMLRDGTTREMGGGAYGTTQAAP